MRMTIRYKYDEIKTKRTKKYRDENGKWRQKTKTFSQTINPFNKTKDGKMKTREQILIEINAEADAWMETDDVG